MSVAHELAACVLPDHASRFSRHDFTLAQLFACLVLREQLKMSYRKLEALLADTDWCVRLGMSRVPDHSTLCRAFKFIIARHNINSMLDVITRHHQHHAPKLGRTLAIDSPWHRRFSRWRACGEIRGRTEPLVSVATAEAGPSPMLLIG